MGVGWFVWVIGTYEKERPWNVEVFEMELVYEEDEDAGDYEGGEELPGSDEVEGKWWVGRGFLGDLIWALAKEWTHLK